MDLREVSNALQNVERLNFGSEGFGASFISAELTNPAGAAVILISDGKVVGYTAAIPADQVYYSNSHYYGREPEGAAYITNSSIHPDYQHKGHIWLMMEKLEEALRARGFEFLDRDSKADLGYADKVVARLKDRVVFAQEAEDTMWGKQRYIRISL